MNNEVKYVSYIFGHLNTFFWEFNMQLFWKFLVCFFFLLICICMSSFYIFVRILCWVYELGITFIFVGCLLIVFIISFDEYHFFILILFNLSLLNVWFVILGSCLRSLSFSNVTTMLSSVLLSKTVLVCFNT